MDAARALREARRRAGLTQRQLAQRTNVPQPAIARIESGRVSPRVDTLDRLLRVTGEQLRALPRLGIGVDRSLIASFLQQSPRQRLETLAGAAEAMSKLREAGRRAQTR